MEEDICIMGFGRTEFDKIYVHANAIYTDGVYHYTTEYTTPDPDGLAYKAQLDKYNTEYTTVINKTGGKPATERRNDEADDMYDMLELRLLNYVNKKYKGNAAMLLLSGFPLKSGKTTHGLVEKLEIKDIIPGTEPNSCRVRLKRRPKGSGPKTPETVFYTLYATADPSSPANFKPILVTTNGNKLIAKNIDVQNFTYYGVTARNAAGENELSGVVRYRPSK